MEAGSSLWRKAKHSVRPMGDKAVMTDRDGAGLQGRAAPGTLVCLEQSTEEKKSMAQNGPPGVTVDP